MSLDIQAATYSSGAEMIAAYKARQQRFAAAARKVKQEEEARPVIRIGSTTVKVTPEAKAEGPPPAWTFSKCHFDDHVVAYRLHQADCFRTLGSPIRTYIQKRAIEMGLTYSQVISRSRKVVIVQARQLIMWEVKNVLRTGAQGEKDYISLPEIGRIFGGKDHTSVLHAIRKVDAMKAAEAA